MFRLYAQKENHTSGNKNLSSNRAEVKYRYIKYNMINITKYNAIK